MVNEFILYIVLFTSENSMDIKSKMPLVMILVLPNRETLLKRALALQSTDHWFSSNVYFYVAYVVFIV